MLPCAAYLRIYEPLSAFGPAQRAHWAGYAASAGRPRRVNALAQEYAESLCRLIALPPIVAPLRESKDAYVRWADGVTYICPWQTRLRSWLALSSLRSTVVPPLADAFAPQQASVAAEHFARWEKNGGSNRLYIQTNGWSVPLSWFVPFAPTERWLVLGTPTAGEAGQAGETSKGPATAAATRTLVYATAMSQARRRVARSLATTRRVPVSGLAEPGQTAAALLQIGTELEDIGRWLEEFHPHSLVELDYGGLVQLLDDDALRGDQSVAEVAAAVNALSSGELELAAAMYQRLRTRWRALEAIELGS
ncbi:MAG: hypothetical protein ABJB47_01410 [Actinomycetota bacterium]